MTYRVLAALTLRQMLDSPVKFQPPLCELCNVGEDTPGHSDRVGRKVDKSWRERIKEPRAPPQVTQGHHQHPVVNSLKQIATIKS